MSEKLLNDLECSFMEAIQNKIPKNFFFPFCIILFKNIWFIIEKYSLLLTWPHRQIHLPNLHPLQGFLLLKKKNLKELSVLKKIGNSINTANAVFTSMLSECNNSDSYIFC